MYEKEDTSWSFGIGLFIGAVAGAALASLFAPRSGQQNREAVVERGLVLKNRVSDRANAVSTSVKDTTNSALSTVKDTTSSAVASVKETTSHAVTSVKETTSSAVETVKDTTSTVVAKVSDTAATVKEKASDVAEKLSDTASATVEKVQDVTSTAVQKVQDVAGAAAEKVQDVAGTATDKARSIVGGAATSEDAELPTPVATLATEARYDAEDVRPVATSSGSTPATAQPDALKALHDIDTFEPTATAQEPGTLNEVLPGADAQSTLTASLETAAIDASPEPSAETLRLDSDKIAAVNEAVSELSSDEQFEITEAGAALTDDQASATTTRAVAGPNTTADEPSADSDRTA